MCGRALGDLLRQEQRYDEAVAVYRSLPPAAFSFAGAYAGYVDALFHQGAHAEAERLARRWLGMARAEQEARQMEWANAVLFNITRERGETETAMAHARAAIEANPESNLALPLAEMLHAQGRTAEAKERLAAFLDVTGDAKLRIEAEQLLAQW